MHFEGGCRDPKIQQRETTAIFHALEITPNGCTKTNFCLIFALCSMKCSGHLFILSYQTVEIVPKSRLK